MLEQREGPDGKSKAVVVVVTSYGTLVSEFSKAQDDNKPSSPVFESEFVTGSHGILSDLFNAFSVEWKRMWGTQTLFLLALIQNMRRDHS